MRGRVLLAFSLLLLFAAGCDGNGTEADPLVEGDRAPGFTLPSASGGKVGLSDFAEEKPVLLYFSMGPGWSGCVLQVVDLQKDKEFRDLGVELLSIAPDPPDAWRDAGREMGIRDFDGVLSDAENKVASSYGVLRWAVGDEPGHTFVLVNEAGEVAWLQDYGALENGGVMYVLPHEVVRQVREHL